MRVVPDGDGCEAVFTLRRPPDMSDEEFQHHLDLNLKTCFAVTRAVLPAMMRRRYGRIVNIASVTGPLVINPKSSGYGTAKAAMVGYTRAVAIEVASKGITVNAVAPGFIDTDMTRALNEEQRAALTAQVPMARLGSVDDIAAAVLFLCGPGASYITGETLHVNGGMYMA